MTRILIDQDSVIYDITVSWYGLHNREHGHIHSLQSDQWYDVDICKSKGCPSNAYEYFNQSEVWTEGTAIQNSIEVTKTWTDLGYELAVLTHTPNSIAATYKLDWLYKTFPHIPNIVLVNTKIKHWINGDFLIDDSPNNLEHFSGIRILFDQGWNRDSNYLRAKDWNHLDTIIQRGAYLLEYWKRYDDKYNLVEHMLKEEFQ